MSISKLIRLSEKVTAYRAATVFGIPASRKKLFHSFVLPIFGILQLLPEILILEFIYACC